MRVRPSDLHTLPIDDKLHWSRPAYLNNWLNWGNGHRPGGYAIDELGWVCLRGLVMSTAASITTPNGIFWLPQSLAPASNEIFMGNGNRNATNQSMRVDVQSNGMIVYDPVGGSGAVAYLSLLGIRWKPHRRYQEM